MSTTANRTTTIPIITCGGTFITPGAGYSEAPRQGGNNYVSPPMSMGNSVPPATARRRRINGLIVHNVANDRISNTVTPFRVSRNA